MNTNWPTDTELMLYYSPPDDWKQFKISKPYDNYMDAIWKLEQVSKWIKSNIPNFEKNAWWRITEHNYHIVFSCEKYYTFFLLVWGDKI